METATMEMGYTHYWSILDKARWEAIWPDLVKDVPLIIEVANIPLSGFSISVEPRISLRRGVFLNGVDADSHEPFELYWYFSKQLLYRYCSCQTSRKPYDLVVATILMRAKMLVGETFTLSSDGQWDSDEWVRARKLYETIWFEKLTAEQLHFNEVEDSSDEDKDEEEGNHEAGNEDEDEDEDEEMMDMDTSEDMSEDISSKATEDGDGEEEKKWDGASYEIAHHIKS